MIDADPVLGNVIANYPSDRGRLLLPAVLITGIAAVLLNFTIATVEAWWGPVLTVILMAFVVLVVGWRTLHFWNREVILYENGFTYREGARTVPFLYNEIMSIRQQGQRLAYFGGLIRRNTYRFTLTGLRGELMTLDNLYRRVDKMGAQIEARVYPILEPYLTERIAAGEKISFSNSLRVSAAGLHDKGRDLTWDALAGYRIASSQLLLLAHPDQTVWLSLPLSEVDNLPLFVKLIKTRAQS